MKTTITVAVTLLAVFLLLSSGGLVATYAATPGTAHSDRGSDGPSASQALSLQIGGAVINAGIQRYSIQQTGKVVSATVAGFTVDPTQPVLLQYRLEATIDGTSASGNANFRLTAALADGSGTLYVSGKARIVSTVAAVCLPNYDTPNTDGSCPTGDTSEVPAFFVGIATVQVAVTTPSSHNAPDEQSAPTQTMTVPMLFESAYLNPFGMPIVFGSADNFATLLVITPYNQATIDWNNVVIAGELGGVYGSSQVAGTFTEVSHEHENLVTGVAQDSGMMTFSNVVNATGYPVNALDATGEYRGTSTIPTAGSYDCSTTLGFPAGSGVCTETGFMSTGNFNLHGQGSSVMGSYSTQWTVPAFGFQGTATGSVTTHYNEGD